VAPPLSPSGPRRPASTVHGQLATRATIDQLAEAALRMMEVNMRAGVVPAADCLR
jgi:hypothetical protein